MADEVEEFLAHYGIKGMRWGVVREKKPVSAEVQAKREVNAQKYEAKARDYQKQIDAVSSQTYKSKRQQRAAVEQVDELKRVKERAITDASRKREGKLSLNERNAVIGASVVAAVLAYKFTRNGIESGEFRRLSEKGKGMFPGGQKFEFLRKADLADRNLSPDEIQSKVLKGINPKYGDIGTKMNCRRCTFAYEMRRRGYDVAATRTTNANGQNAAGLLNAVSPGDKLRRTSRAGLASEAVREAIGKTQGKDTPLISMAENFSAGGKNKVAEASAKGIFEALSNQPNGARGEIGVEWAMGGGHSMIYEIINNKPVIFDGQSGEKFLNVEQFAKVGDAAKAAGFTRLDNVPLNTDYLMRWLKNA